MLSHSHYNNFIFVWYFSIPYFCITISQKIFIKELYYLFVYKIYFLKKEFLNSYHFSIHCCLFDSVPKFLNIVDLSRTLKLPEKIKARRHPKKREQSLCLVLCPTAMIQGKILLKEITSTFNLYLYDNNIVFSR